MTYETLTLEKEGATRVITLSRPERLNAMNYQMTADLEKAIAEVEEDEEAMVIILTGAGRGFCAGADMKELSQPGAKRLPIRRRYTFFNKLEDLEKPVIAAINGACNGGGLELALCCDLRIASETATFGLGEVKLGVIPAGGGTARLPRLIGVGRAKEFLYFGNRVDAEEAHRIGLVNWVVPSEKLMEEAKKWAAELGERAPLALKMLKSCVNLGMQMDLLGAINYESKCATLLRDTEDRVEGTRAFLEKRKPQFKGK
jgi:enoyl-CoA hydratase